ARVVPVGESAARRVPGEIGTEPLLLRRARRRGDVAVEGDDVPRPDGVAVVPLPGVAREHAEVRVIRRRAGAVVLVIARRRARPRTRPAESTVATAGSALAQVVGTARVSPCGPSVAAWSRVVSPGATVAHAGLGMRRVVGGGGACDARSQAAASRRSAQSRDM